MIVIEAPNPIPALPGGPMVFLAGSIEMGVAVDWQTELIAMLWAHGPSTLTVLNPRRKDWDSSWEQSIDNPQFFKQVTWELTGLERADFTFMYFDPATKSPITLLELGLLASRSMFSDNQLVVCCPDGFWRKGNVDIVCQRFEVPVVADLTGFLPYVDEA